VPNVAAQVPDPAYRQDALWYLAAAAVALVATPVFLFLAKYVQRQPLAVGGLMSELGQSATRLIASRGSALQPTADTRKLAVGLG
jgi:hypothetical protein